MTCDFLESHLEPSQLRLKLERDTKMQVAVYWRPQDESYGEFLSLQVNIWGFIYTDSWEQNQIWACNLDDAHTCFWVCSLNFLHLLWLLSTRGHVPFLTRKLQQDTLTSRCPGHVCVRVNIWTRKNITHKHTEQITPLYVYVEQHVIYIFMPLCLIVSSKVSIIVAVQICNPMAIGCFCKPQVCSTFIFQLCISTSFGLNDPAFSPQTQLQNIQN